jgi:uncharacterized membrane protein
VDSSEAGRRVVDTGRRSRAGRAPDDAGRTPSTEGAGDPTGPTQIGPTQTGPSPGAGLTSWFAARPVLSHLPVAVLIVGYVARFCELSLHMYNGYGDSAFDLGIFDQGLWLLSRFHAPFVTVMGRNLFGDHASFILLPIVPLYWLFPEPQGVLVLQTCVLAAGAVPVYLLARKRLHSTALATLFAAAYLLNPALQQGNLEQFHPEAFLVLSIAVALYAALERKAGLLAIAVVVSLLVKEDTALLIVPLGLWVLIRRDRRWGIRIIVAGLAWALFAYGVVIATILGTATFYADRIPFGGLGGFFSTLFGHPARMWSYVRSGGRPFYVWQLGFSVGWGFVLAPEVAAIGLLSLAENVLSTDPYMHQITYHYSMALVPVLVLGTVTAVATLKTKGARVIATGVVVICAFWSCTLWGLAPFSVQRVSYWDPAGTYVKSVNAVEAALPANAVVSAWYPYVVHIDHRTGIYLWPTPFSAEYWGATKQSGERLPAADHVQFVMLPARLGPTDAPTVLAHIKSQYRVVKEVGGVVLYQRIGT